MCLYTRLGNHKISYPFSGPLTHIFMPSLSTQHLAIGEEGVTYLIQKTVLQSFLPGRFAVIQTAREKVWRVGTGH